MTQDLTCAFAGINGDSMAPKPTRSTSAEVSAKLSAPPVITSPRLAGRRLSQPRAIAHHLVKQLYLLMELRQMTMAELSRQSGVGYGTLKSWWAGNTKPDIVLLDFALHTLGYQLGIEDK